MVRPRFDLQSGPGPATLTRMVTNKILTWLFWAIIVILVAAAVVAALYQGCVLLAAAQAHDGEPLCSWAYWQEVFTLAYWQEGGEKGTSRSEVLRNFLLAAIALGALIVGSMRARSAHRQANVAEQGNF